MNREPFHDPRLAPQENKAVEMLRNGMSREDIADELDIDAKHLSVLFYNARRKGVDVPKAKAGNPGPGKVRIEKIVELYDTLNKRGFKGAGIWRTMSERTGLSINCLRVRMWRYKKRIGPAYAIEEGPQP